MPYDNLELPSIKAAEEEEGSDEETENEVAEGSKDKAKKKRGFKTGDMDTIAKARDWMCRNFYDVRAFGAVMSTTAYNCGQVRGPIQITFARSYDRIWSQPHGITRVNQTKESKQIETGGAGTFGDKHTVAYGLYCAKGFVCPQFAASTGFSNDDLEVLWKSLACMLPDPSASRGLMAARHLFVFEHKSSLGEAPAHKLFELISAELLKCDKRTGKPIEFPRKYEDYVVSDVETIRKALPPGVSVADKISS